MTNRCVWRVACGVRRVGAVAAGDVADGRRSCRGRCGPWTMGTWGGLSSPTLPFLEKGSPRGSWAARATTLVTAPLNVAPISISLPLLHPSSSLTYFSLSLSLPPFPPSPLPLSFPLPTHSTPETPATSAPSTRRPPRSSTSPWRASPPSASQVPRSWTFASSGPLSWNHRPPSFTTRRARELPSRRALPSPYASPSMTSSATAPP